MLRLSQDSDQNRLATSAAAFITSHGPDIHMALAGSSRYSKEVSRFEPDDAYSSLEQLLKQYLPENLSVNFENDSKKLQQLSETLTYAESNFSTQNSGFWHSIWGGIGEGRSVLDGWVALIPNEYGLSVVKMGLAVVFKWIESINSDLILVDAHLYNANMPKISAVSVFSASLITSLVSASPDAVVIHYFCGIHFTPNDKWVGPKGLIRFITMQLLLRLMATQNVDLGFIDTREFVQDLEDQDFPRLCDLLYSIIEQFSEEVTIWCIVDSIQRFDKPSTMADLKFVMDFLHHLVDDTTLSPAVKIFMTNPNHSKKSITQLSILESDPTRLISLRPTTAKATRRLSDRAIGDQISQALQYRQSGHDTEY
ncbi:hypothetical protein N7486_003423 [Penicillium sp. IBT 16267x]|nr:hypothetical protein N7486_003423 [Penicillium sp. IBT 16267x]